MSGKSKTHDYTTIEMWLDDLLHGDADAIARNSAVLRDVVAVSHELNVAVTILVHIFLRAGGLLARDVRPPDPRFWRAAQFALVPKEAGSVGADRNAELDELAERMRACFIKHAGQARADAVRAYVGPSFGRYAPVHMEQAIRSAKDTGMLVERRYKPLIQALIDAHYRLASPRSIGAGVTAIADSMREYLSTSSAQFCESLPLLTDR